jgi:hypothetical protein
MKRSSKHMLVSQTANGQEISAGLEVAEDGPYACANDPQDSKNMYKDLSKKIYPPSRNLESSS